MMAFLFDPARSPALPKRLTVEIGDFVGLQSSAGFSCEVQVIKFALEVDGFIGKPVVWDPRILVPTPELPTELHFRIENIFTLEYGMQGLPTIADIPLTVHGPDANGVVEIRVVGTPVATFNSNMLDMLEMVSAVRAALVQRRAKRALAH